ncbi:MAG: hypothetical protein M1833_005129 [Piccolia ochrophora]|nr:MAG: hypothetical protein M1833_005129 [Piccolia ochrophora]
MSSGIEALYIFDQHNNPILQHIYRSRPASASTLLPLYLAQPAPRPPLTYIHNTSPPTLLFSLLHANLLFLSPTSTDTEPLLVLEFLHRVVDVLEEFLGAPLLASKIEGGYDVVAQLLGEMCDAGAISNTEPNALRDVVEVPGWVGKLLGGVGIPATTSSTLPPTNPLSLPNTTPNPQSTGSQLPWRRANVRHTSNELYVDILESLSVTIAPSGRPLAAFANGSIAFTSKISGVPDLLLTLSAPGGKASVERAIELPVFHPCVRLARWREKPGELSFVPPDGRFVLAGYEVDLLPSFPEKASFNTPINLHLPVSLQIRTNLGPTGADFEARLTLSPPASATNTATPPSRPAFPSRLGTSSPAFGGSTNAPSLEEIAVKIPVPPLVRNLSELRTSRGEAHYAPGDHVIEWRLPTKDSTSGVATLRCTVVGVAPGTGDTDSSTIADPVPLPSTYAYDEDTPYQSSGPSAAPAAPTPAPATTQQTRDERRAAANASLMPSSATVSFAVKGWLASGIRVESLVVSTRTSRGLGEGVRPYKGVKYLTVSKEGVEIRC